MAVFAAQKLRDIMDELFEGGLIYSYQVVWKDGSRNEDCRSGPLPSTPFEIKTKLWRVICPHCKTVIFEGNPGGQYCIASCRNCGNIYRLCAFEAGEPELIKRWSKEIQ